MVNRNRVEALDRGDFDDGKIESLFVRITSYWVSGGAVASILLLVLMPLLVAHGSASMVAAYLILPAYMLHQLEEHDADRFRLDFNSTVGQGQEALTPLAVFIINVPGTWLAIALSLLAAARAGHGWALVAVYLVLVNAVVHVAYSAVFKKYNPGLGTAVGVFLPLGAWTLWLIASESSTRWWHHALGIAVAVAAHAAILGYVTFRLRRLGRSA